MNLLKVMLFLCLTLQGNFVGEHTFITGIG